MRPRPITAAHPAHKPYSSGFPFVDGKGPVPYEFFDETQDHLGVLAHAGTGWAWSRDVEDFNGEVYPVGFLGQLTMINLPVGAGLSLTPMSVLNFQGEHGVWRGLSGVAQWDFTLQSNACHVGTQDFLISAKVLCLARANLDPVDSFGFWLGCGPKVGAGVDPPRYPAICGGGDKANWQIYAAPAEGQAGVYFDTGIPFHDSLGTMPDTVQRAWHVLQISRVGGAFRFFINGRLIRLNGNGLTDREGIYYPTSLPEVRRFFRTRRWRAGPINEGFLVDFFHRLCRRG